jgi:hypothetical protein
MPLAVTGDNEVAAAAATGRLRPCRRAVLPRSRPSNRPLPKSQSWYEKERARGSSRFLSALSLFCDPHTDDSVAAPSVQCFIPASFFVSACLPACLPAHLPACACMSCRAQFKMSLEVSTLLGEALRYLDAHGPAVRRSNASTSGPALSLALALPKSQRAAVATQMQATTSTFGGRALACSSSVFVRMRPASVCQRVALGFLDEALDRLVCEVGTPPTRWLCVRIALA